ncbi:uncharacterized protein, partial [Mobula birostris]|uniref:uncharacterized protein n=1 Tax=Mobula birostris TaxID=1983395 RepID=UPI003B28A8E5
MREREGDRGPPPTTMEGPAVESAADILACVREQEVQFERLTQALEKERRDTSFHSVHSPEHGDPSWNRQITNGPVYGSGQPDRWLVTDSPQQNGPKDLPFPYSPRARMLQDPGPYIEETVTGRRTPTPRPPSSPWRWTRTGPRGGPRPRSHCKALMAFLAVRDSPNLGVTRKSAHPVHRVITQIVDLDDKQQRTRLRTLQLSTGHRPP